MVGEIVSNGLHRSLGAQDWASFARGYNGPNYAINRYDTRLAAAYNKLSTARFPISRCERPRSTSSISASSRARWTGSWGAYARRTHPLPGGGGIAGDGRA